MVALKVGWSSVEDEFPDVKLDFYGAPGRHMADIVVSEGRLLSSSDFLRQQLKGTSGGSSEIKNCYDWYLVCGLGLNIFNAVRVYNRYRAETHVRESCTPVSDDCFLQAVIGCAREMLSIEILKKLRKITDAPVRVIAVPFLGRENKTNVHHLLKIKDADSVATFFRLACDQLAAEHNARFLPQPKQTLRKRVLLTRSAYTQDAVRFSEAITDGIHMNADYGAIVLRQALVAHQCEAIS